MLNLENGIDSLTNFKRQTAECLRRLRKAGSPMVLMVNGKAEVVVQDAAAYQRLEDLAERVDRDGVVAAICEGLADAGRVKPARKALRLWRRNTAFPRRTNNLRSRLLLTDKADVESV